MSQDKDGQIKRGPDGRLLPGTAPVTRSGGRKRLPEEYVGLGPVALAVQTALATGVVVRSLVPGELSDEQKAAAFKSIEAAAAAGEVDPGLRGEHAQRMVDRIHGKAPQAVEVSGNPDAGEDDPLVKALVGLAQAATAKKDAG